MNTLLVEILEKIIIKAADSKNSLKKYGLVCRTWALIVNPILWKEFNFNGPTSSRDKGNEWRFYRHITKREYVSGKYIQKLTLEYLKLQHIHIVKILRACPNIVDLTIKWYILYGNYSKKGKVNDFLEQIQILLPKLRRLNLERSHYEITGIEKLIANRKDLEIIATRECNKKHCDFISSKDTEKYNGKEWEECPTCIREKTPWFIKMTRVPQ